MSGSNLSLNRGWAEAATLLASTTGEEGDMATCTRGGDSTRTWQHTITLHYIYIYITYYITLHYIMHYTLTRLGRLEEEPTALATVTVYSPESEAVTLLTIVSKNV